ncbi:MAG: hypothetical protein EA412_01865 [Chitinophagaceae bacterium]|nr:MAG: hypothetical protein EA412_01865 [Chitinophagaceae bacterium]
MKKQLLHYFLGQLAPAISGIILIVLAVRLLGEEEYGFYAVIYSSLVLIHNLFFGWVQQSLLRFISQYENLRKVVLNKFLFINSLSAISAGLTAFILSLLFFKLDVSNALWIGSFMVLYVFLTFYLISFQAFFKTAYYAFTNTFYYLGYIIFFLILIYTLENGSYMLIFKSMVFTLILIHIYALSRLHKKFKINFSKAFVDKDFIKRAFNFGFPLTLWLFVSLLLGFSDRYIIFYYLGAEETGTYTAIYDMFYKISTFVCLPVLYAFHPQIMDLWNKDKRDEAVRLIKKAMKIEIAAALAFILLLIPIAPPVIFNLLKLEGAHLHLISIVIVAGGFAWQLAMFAHKPQELLFRQKFMLAGVILALLLNISLNFLFIPVYGITAAAFTTLISAVFYLLIMSADSLKIRKRLH